MNMRLLSMALALTACGNVVPYPSIGAGPDAPTDTVSKVPPDAGPLLWSGANLVLATAYCNLGVRCGTGDYQFEYGSGSAAFDACVQTLDDSLCYGQWEGEQMCASAYGGSDRFQYLAACPDDSAAVDCEDGDLNWVLSCNLAAPWSEVD